MFFSDLENDMEHVMNATNMFLLRKPAGVESLACVHEMHKGTYHRYDAYDFYPFDGAMERLMADLTRNITEEIQLCINRYDCQYYKDKIPSDVLHNKRFK